MQSRPDHGESLRICLQASCAHYPEGNNEADGTVQITILERLRAVTLSWHLIKSNMETYPEKLIFC